MSRLFLIIPPPVPQIIGAPYPIEALAEPQTVAHAALHPGSRSAIITVWLAKRRLIE